MKTLVRAAILVSGAAGFCIAFAVSAGADVGNPASTYESAIKIALSRQAVQAASKPAVQPQAAKPEVAKPEPEKATESEERGEPVATPVPESFVSQGPAPVVARAHERRSVVDRIVFGAGAKYRALEAFVGRVASTAQDGSGPGTGVPVLALGVLAAVAVVEHQRRHNRWATDENALELLYSRELTPPG